MKDNFAKLKSEREYGLIQYRPSLKILSI